MVSTVRQKSPLEVCVRLMLVFTFVYLFLLSIGLMSAAFKGFGKDFALALIEGTSNPFVALFIGILATSLVQSSSTTTSVVVGMVASGALTVSNAIPLMMGANIGTTVTNTLVSLGHMGRRDEFRRAIAGATVHDFFNLLCVIIMFPLELATGFLSKAAAVMATLFSNVGGLKFASPVKMIVKPVVKEVKHLLIDTANIDPNGAYLVMVIVSFILLFVSLYFIVKLMKSLVMERAEAILDRSIGKSGTLCIFIGILLTIMVQSSSITTSLLIPLIGAGILSLRMAFPITLGANIGTTCTAMLASLASGDISAITIAFVHFLFNTFGVLFIYPFEICREIPIRLAKKLGGIAAVRRRFAFLFVLSVFFFIPLTIIFISETLFK